MATEPKDIGSDIYLTYQVKGKKPYTRHHRVWDAERFFMSQLESCVKQEPPVLVTLATQSDYRGQAK